MDRHQVRYALLKVTLTVLLGTTWVFCSFLFATRPEVPDDDTLTSLVRLPASLPAQIPGISAIPGLQQGLPGLYMPPLKAATSVAMDVVKVPCWDKVTGTREVSARWVRLTGKACEDVEGRAGDVTVRNLTNGYTATVFSVEAKNMTTDFIPLEAGKNEILIRFDQGTGVQLESQVTFDRE